MCFWTTILWYLGIFQEEPATGEAFATRKAEQHPDLDTWKKKKKKGLDL